MTEPVLISRLREGLHDLDRLIEQRVRGVPQVEQAFQSRNQAAETEFQAACQQVIDRFESEKRASQEEFQHTQDKVAKRFARERLGQDELVKETSNRLNAHFEAESLTLRNELNEARAAATATREANLRATEAEQESARDQLNDAILARKQIERQAKKLLQEWRQDPEHDVLPPAARPDRKYKEAARQLADTLTTAEGQLAELRALRLPAFFKGWRPAWLFLVLFIVIAGPGSLSVVERDYRIVGLAVGAAVSLIVGAGLCFWLHALARKRIDRAYLPLLRTLTEADTDIDKALEQIQDQYERKQTGHKKVCEKEIRTVSEKVDTKRKVSESRRDAQLLDALEKLERDKDASTYRRDTELRAAHEKYQKLRTEIFGRYENDSHQIHQRHYRRMTESKEQYDAEWKALIDNWTQGLESFASLVREINQECDALFPDWNDSMTFDRRVASSVPPVIRFGSFVVDLGLIPEGLPKEERLKITRPVRFSLPALLPFPHRSSLLVKMDASGRDRAVKLLQAVMLRYLRSVPPGKVRFTIIDPVSLGENFAAFMHLADYEEVLINSRIWTEGVHIEQRLGDLSAHMEDVIQKYLRNQYKTIEEYNAHAGEVAEPYRIPVIADFPSNFSMEAARRLVSVVTSGSRCGVYALISVDTSQDFPSGFDLAGLEQVATVLDWQKDHFVWKDPDFEKFPFEPDAPPNDEICTRLLQRAGELARQAGRVEVPFDFIATPRESWWQEDSCGGVRVALGRAGAIKRQELRLGHGTSQHVLIAGKTGSGKSSLLHALITNLALSYSPDEIELYLIDFKKGVEFKTYAAHELPHARVVAIESDREFGLSVLQRLDAELKVRGERFREAGVQDLYSYRDSNGKLPAPRILLIVDEFQEFFVEDDKISQDAAQLLDRLVRQGRAFGLHVLLGSQTLGGAYTLARSTIDQMAVRIALQCSEADAQLILSDGNSAARLLSRPGEAIYNDANGLVEGNNPFQVVWLPEQRREQLLDEIRALDRKQNPGASRRQIVFEGNAPAVIANNRLLQSAIGCPNWPTKSQPALAWLGEAMAIKDPTTAVFRRQTGDNLLIIGQDESAALAIQACAIVSLASQQLPLLSAPLVREDSGDGTRSTAANFYIFDATPTDAVHAGYLARLPNFLPHAVQINGWREAPALLAKLASEIERRQKGDGAEGPEMYLLIHGLHRFRDLRRDEDDFGYSQTEDKMSPAKHLAFILRDGPGLGIHVLVWCDTLANAGRCLDRQAMREFSMRVLFQMSAGDSSTLIDSPLASRLGPHRGYFHNQDEGRLEKFRPYGLPEESWLRSLKEQLRRKQ